MHVNLLLLHFPLSLHYLCSEKFEDFDLLPLFAFSQNNAHRQSTLSFWTLFYCFICENQLICSIWSVPSPSHILQFFASCFMNLFFGLSVKCWKLITNGYDFSEGICAPSTRGEGCIFTKLHFLVSVIFCCIWLGGKKVFFFTKFKWFSKEYQWEV